MRNFLIVLWMLLCSITSAGAQVSVGIGLPGVSIGINLPVYPEFARVPGYPVYYAPRVSSNYFFYDGMYWVYQGDNWYASTWYNGPWGLVASERVPLFVLRVPVRYYRQPPPYFHGWRSDAPPRWGEHWGSSWEQNHRGWDNWNHNSAPSPAPLPSYQRQYSGSRYPQMEQQQTLHSRNYRYQPKDTVVQQHYQAQRPTQGATQRDQKAPRAPGEKKPAADKMPAHQASPAAQHPTQQQKPAASQHEQKTPKPEGGDKSPQGKGSAKEPKQGREKGDKQGG